MADDERKLLPLITETRSWTLVSAQDAGGGNYRHVEVTITAPVEIQGQIEAAFRDGPGSVCWVMREFKLSYLPEPKCGWGDEHVRAFLVGYGTALRAELARRGIPFWQLRITCKALWREITIHEVQP